MTNSAIHKAADLMVPYRSITLTGTIPVERKKCPLAVNGASDRTILWFRFYIRFRLVYRHIQTKGRMRWTRPITLLFRGEVCLASTFGSAIPCPSKVRSRTLLLVSSLIVYFLIFILFLFYLSPTFIYLKSSYFARLKIHSYPTKVEAKANIFFDVYFSFIFFV